MTLPDARARRETAPAARALVELFELLDAEDWDRLVEHLDPEVQLADELTGSWLRGRDAVAGYLRAQRGVVTGIRSKIDDVHLAAITAGTYLATFHMQQSYRLVGREHRETLTGCCMLRVDGTEWTLLLFDLGSVTGSVAAADGAGSGEVVEAGEAVGDRRPDVEQGASPEEASLGEKIKALRTQRGMSLRALADRARLSPGFLSQVERDLADPSVASLLRIAEGLEIPASALVDAPPPSDALVVSRQAQRSRVPLGRGGLSVATLPAPPGSRLMAHLRTYDAPATATPSPPDEEGQDTLFFLVSGRAELQHQGHAQALEEGDAVALLPSTPYRLSPPPGEAVTVLVVGATPSR